MTITQDNRIGYALNLNTDHILGVIAHVLHKVGQSVRMTGTINMLRTRTGAEFEYRPGGSGKPAFLGSITVSEERGA